MSDASIGLSLSLIVIRVRRAEGVNPPSFLFGASSSRWVARNRTRWADAAPLACPRSASGGCEPSEFLVLCFIFALGRKESPSVG